MQLVLLVTKEMLPIPPDVRIVEDWGSIAVHTEDSRSIIGNHMMLDGCANTIKDWLVSFDGVWLGEGAPMEQQFSVFHIAKD
jgi:hypothetical protein